ncbi:MAG TPA: polymer-forming cytoskeletal protein [Actinomycetota bacterium]|nr:polymer-forming cytoskeletal protein [Actinomycetota bacterium]
MATLRRAFVAAALAIGVLALGAAVAGAQGSGTAPEPEAQIVLSGTVTVPRGREVDEVVVFHGRATIGGAALGDVVVLDGPIVVNGQVSGSVIAVNGDVTLGPGAQVRGNVMAGGTVTADPQAQVFGDVSDGVSFTLQGPLEAVGRFLVWLALSISTLLILAALLLVAPRGADAVHAAATTAPWPSAGWGLSCLIGLPVLAGLLIASVLGLPLGLTLLLALAFILFVGFALSAWVVGRLIWSPPRSRWLALLFGWLVASAATIVPVLGAVIWILAAGFGLGAATVATWRARGHHGTHRAGYARAVIPAAPSPEAGPGPIQEEVGL